ncbi:uncharacterized protein LOC143046939 [Mytilus galloprovincialis]|uniref:uncharacterized protein LOC143046939 n=1 Tax=Mytilus galloprovincialis TaxID=29158 RepID=UPI003F7CA162
MVTFNIQVAVSAESTLGEYCNSTTPCKDANAMCFGVCKCKNAFNKDSMSRCTSTMLGAVCSSTTQCKDGNAMCSYTCVCKDTFYKDNNSGCKPFIYPNQRCANIIFKNDSCVINAYCNASNVCVCGFGFTTTPTSCIPAHYYGSGSPAVQTTVLQSSQEIACNQKGNSAVTMTVMEISTIIVCLMLVYLEVLK